MTVDVSQLLTIFGAAGSTALTLWAHSREFRKEKRATLEAYADSQIKQEGQRRDIEHLKRDLQQMSGNVAHLNDETEERFRQIESSVSRLIGAVETFKSLRSSKLD